VFRRIEYQNWTGVSKRMMLFDVSCVA